VLLAGRGLDVWRGQWSEPLRRRGRCLLAACLVLGLVAVGASASMARPSAVPAKVALAGGTLLAVSALLRSRAARAAAPAGLTGAIAVLAAVDVAWAGRHVNPLAPAAFYRYRPPLAARLAETGGDVRLFVRQESAERLNDLLVRGPGGWDSEEGWALGAQDRLVPPLGARWRIAGSYDGDFTGLATPVYSMFSFVLPALERQAIALKFLRLGSVTHVSSLRERPFPGLEPLATFDSVFAGPVRLFRVPDPFPRAYVVGGARTAADEGAITAIGDPGFDPRREVLLPPGTPVAVSPAGFTSEARVSWRRMDSLGIAAESSGPGWLVVTEAWQRGWTARVDGAAAPVIRANGLFRAVPLPGGRHEVVLRYDPPGLRLGLALSLAGLAVGLVAVRRPAPEGRR
jgi:hypothetical protein